tara:strand:+ start:146 stop:568 length:423 start_codon:yes stop_codon:yes gene_type:complete
MMVEKKRPLTARQERFAVAFIETGGDKLKSYKIAGYSQEMNNTKLATEANKLYNRPMVSLRISELQKVKLTVYVKSKEDKLKILDDLIDACSKLDDEKGVLNAPAVISAIKEHNIMQGDNAPTKIESTVEVRTTLDDFYA